MIEGILNKYFNTYFYFEKPILNVATLIRKTGLAHLT